MDAFDELTERTRKAVNIGKIAAEIAMTLRFRFEHGKKIHIEGDNSGDYPLVPPNDLHTGLCQVMGFVSYTGQTLETPYLNKDAKVWYERLLREGYYVGPPESDDDPIHLSDLGIQHS
jgi:hypothetical protein